LRDRRPRWIQCWWTRRGHKRPPRQPLFRVQPSATASRTRGSQATTVTARSPHPPTPAFTTPGSATFGGPVRRYHVLSFPFGRQAIPMERAGRCRRPTTFRTRPLRRRRPPNRRADSTTPQRAPAGPRRRHRSTVCSFGENPPPRRHRSPAAPLRCCAPRTSRLPKLNRISTRPQFRNWSALQKAAAPLRRHSLNRRVVLSPRAESHPPVPSVNDPREPTFHRTPRSGCCSRLPGNAGSSMPATRATAVNIAPRTTEHPQRAGRHQSSAVRLQLRAPRLRHQPTNLLVRTVHDTGRATIPATGAEI